MFERFKRSARIGASYAGSLGEMVRLEAREELQQFTGRMAQRLIAVGLLVFGLVWLNIGAVVLIWDSPYRHWMPFVIAGGLVLIAILVWQTARVDAHRQRFPRARRALDEDARLWGIDLSAAHVLRDLQASAAASAEGASGAPVDAGAGATGATGSRSTGTGPSGTATAMDGTPATSVTAASGPEGEAGPAATPPDGPARIEALDAELDALRAALHQTMTGPRRARAVRGAAMGQARVRVDAQGRPREFQPRSQTMRTLMSVADGEGPLQQWPVRLAATVALTALMRGRLRWLLRALPVLRMAWSVWSKSQDLRNATAARPAEPRPASTDRYSPSRNSPVRPPRT